MRDVSSYVPKIPLILRCTNGDQTWDKNALILYVTKYYKIVSWDGLGQLENTERERERASRSNLLFEQKEGISE